MKIAIITDTHYGARKGADYIHSYFKNFYDNIFFPYLEKHNIDTIIHMGDMFDSRKSIDYQSLEWSKRVVFEPLKKYKVHAITGNHDAYYKNTNKVNSPELLLKDYDNIITYSKPTEINIGGLDILLLPWINSENFEESKEFIDSSKSKIAMGHLEINGFKATRGHMMEDGMDVSIFSKFEKVYSGHFHTRSTDGKIYYLGNPYEMYWNDVNDKRGFHIFDTETFKLEFIQNPHTMFEKIYYDDTDVKSFDAENLKDKIVKVIVRNKSSQLQFDRYIDKINKSGCVDLKVVENFEIDDDDVEFSQEECENTLTLLNKYIEDSDFDLDKTIVMDIMQDVYREACEFQ